MTKDDEVDDHKGNEDDVSRRQVFVSSSPSLFLTTTTHARIHARTQPCPPLTTKYRSRSSPPPRQTSHKQTTPRQAW